MKIPGTDKLGSIARATANAVGDVVENVEDEAIAVFESAGDLVDHVRSDMHAVKVHMDEAIAASLEVAIEHLHIPEPVLAVLRPMQAFADIESCGGVRSNETITQAYAGFDQSFQGYLGEPAVANWTTFGKYASHQAGEAINQLEAILAMDPIKLAKIVAQGPEKLKQLLGEYAAPLFHDASAQAHHHPIATAALPGVLTAYYLVKDLVALRNGLVETNRAIYHNFGPAFQTFLDAEKAGQDGVAELKNQVAAGKIADPGGLLVEALGDYQQAHALTEQLKADPGNQDLAAQREALVARANLLIGMHEQYYVVQPHFQGEFSRLSALVSSKLEVQDANGKFKLLSAGQGNWADFCTRMGLVECEGPAGSNADPANGVLSLVDADGKPHFFRQAAADQLPGTIIDYFTKEGTGAPAVANMAGKV
ncbi:MAG: hypothetical protein JWM80_3460 [Cyanobacteria bacterium RYN_339]|nr:hypothetical protein [Cyanobacteria bacterium RYN_339]